MKKVEATLYFLFLYLVIFVSNLIFVLCVSEPFGGFCDLWMNEGDIRGRFLCVCVFFLLACMLGGIVYFLYKYEKNAFWNSVWAKFKKYKIHIFFVSIVVGFYADIFNNMLYFIFPFLYYYILKKYSNNIVIKEFFLNFNSVKKYFLLLYIIELPFLLSVVNANIFPKQDDFLLWSYYAFSTVRFYMPIFIASWIDDRKKNISCNN